MTPELDGATAPVRMPLIWAETRHSSLRFPFGTGSEPTPKCSGYRALTWLPDRDQLLLTQLGTLPTHRENRKNLGFNCLKVIHFQGVPESRLCCRVRGGQHRPFLRLTLASPQHTNTSQFKRKNFIHLSMKVGISPCLTSCPRQNHHRNSPSTFLTPLNGIYSNC